MKSPNRRQFDPLRRVTAYLPDDLWDFVVSAAATNGWTVSRMVAWYVWEGYQLEQERQREMAEEKLVADGVM